MWIGDLASMGRVDRMTVGIVVLMSMGRAASCRTKCEKETLPEEGKIHRTYSLFANLNENVFCKTTLEKKVQGGTAFSAMPK